MKPFDVHRISVKLSKASPIVFEGLLQEKGSGSRSHLGVMIRNQDGIHVHESFIPVMRKTQNLRVATEALPAGVYEVNFFRNFSQPSTLTNIQVDGAFRLPYAEALAAEIQNGKLNIALSAKDDLIVTKANISVNGYRLSVPLNKDTSGVLPGFVGAFELPADVGALSIGLTQSSVDRALEKMLHLEVILASANSDPLYRGWVNMLPNASAPVSAVELSAPNRSFKVLAYPNIVKWETLRTQSIALQVAVSRDEPIKASVDLKAPSIPNSQVFELQFPVELGTETLPAGSYGEIELIADDGTTLEKVPFSL
jgi:hypothetical protein